MKLCRIGNVGEEKPAIIDQDNNFRDLSSLVEDLNPNTLNFENLDKIQNSDISSLPKLDTNSRIGACVSKPSKFIGIGLNFKDHAEEQNLPIPKEPIIFSKFTSCVTGPNDPIIVPKGSNHTDWEVELGFVIGKKAINVSVDEAMDHVLGFFLVNDVSERNFQKNKGLTWVNTQFNNTQLSSTLYFVKVRLRDGGASTEVNFRIDMRVVITKEMIFNRVGQSVPMRYLRPGVTATTCSGTPPGVGENMKPPVFLKGGETMKNMFQMIKKILNQKFLIIM